MTCPECRLALREFYRTKGASPRPVEPCEECEAMTTLADSPARDISIHMALVTTFVAAILARGDEPSQGSVIEKARDYAAAVIYEEV